MIQFFFFSLFILSTLPARAEIELDLVFQNGHWISEWGEVSIPEGTSSFQLFAKGSKNTFLQISDLVDPEGIIWVSSGSQTKPLTAHQQPVLSAVVSMNRSEGVVPGFSSLLVPNQLKRTEIPAGKWRVRAYLHKEPLEKSVSISWVTKRQIQPGAVGVQVWVSAKSPWKKNPVLLEKVLQQVKKTYAEANIKIDFSPTLEIDAPFQLPMKPPQDMAEIAEALNAPGKLNLYFMPEMEYQSKEMNGLACIGGPLEFDGKHPCFAALFASEKNMGLTLQQQAKIVTHEMGHYLGLHHTQDTGYYGLRVVYDAFDDTSEAITGDNLMDPGIHNKNPTFSPQQKEVLLFHPGIR